jgi:membrane protein implicated in regulation of membrane protease activity
VATVRCWSTSTSGNCSRPERQYPGVLDAAPFIVVDLTLAAALLLVEVALPTFGVAGIGGFGLLGVGVVGLAHGHEPWWPLAFIAVAVCLWAVLLARGSAPAPARVTAAGLYALGAVGFGAAAGNTAAVAVGGAATVGLAAAFPVLLGAAVRLLEQPPHVGMDALGGRRATVVRWDGDRGTIRLDGSLWSAAAEVPLLPGDEVVVVGHDRMVLWIIPAPVAPW